jgi:hypothetical protein
VFVPHFAEFARKSNKAKKAICDRLSTCWKERVQEQKLVVLLSKPAYDFESLISTEHFEVVVCSALQSWLLQGCCKCGNHEGLKTKDGVWETSQVL